MCSCVSFLIDRKLIKGIYGVCLSHPYTVLRFWPLHVATRPMTTKLHIHRDGPREVDISHIVFLAKLCGCNNVCWINKGRKEWTVNYFCYVLAGLFGNKTDQNRHWYPTVHVANAAYYFVVLVMLPRSCLRFLPFWEPFLPVSPSKEATAAMWFSFLTFFWVTIFLEYLTYAKY